MVQVAVCTHHWVIDPPQGPTSRGSCARCGQERFFDNTPTIYGRGGDGRPRGEIFRLSARSSHREHISLSDEH